MNDIIEALLADLRGTDLWERTAAHFRELHGPGFGRPTEPSDPAIAADGATACTVVVRSDLESAPRSAVLLHRDGIEALVEAPGGASVRQPRFAPVGMALAVLTDAESAGRFRPALVDADAISMLPDVDGIVEQLVWSPDGLRLLALVADPGADAAGAQGSGRMSRGDVPDWMPVVMADTPTGGWRRLWCHALGTDTWVQVSPMTVTCWEAVWSGTDAVVAVVSDRPDEAAWFSARLARIDLADGGLRELMSDAPRCIGLPAASPDARWVAAVSATCSDRTVVAGDVSLIDLVDDSTCILDLHEIDVTWQAFSGPTTLVVAGQRGLDTVVAEVDVQTGVVTERWSSFSTTCGQRYPELAVSAAGIALVVEGYAQPAELAVLDGDGPRIVSSFGHTGHRDTTCGAVAAVRWMAPDGMEIEGVLVTPGGAGPFPTITYVHGGPVWAWRSRWSMGYAYTLLFVRQGYAVFHPNPRGSSGRGEEFRTAVIGDLGGAEADDTLSGIDELVRTGIADPDRLAVFGGSHGGYMAAWLITQTDRFAAAMPYCPVTEWTFMRLTTNDVAAQDHLLGGSHGRAPLDHVANVTTPTLITTGTRDLITPASQGLAFHRALAERGVPTGYVEYPLEGHGVRSFPAQIDFSARALGWFDHFLTR